jgi:glycosyltransferase involved in cell wall biosynthesis
MHIVVLENEPSSTRGGQELSLLDVCRELNQRGHQISLIYVKEGNLLSQYHEFCDQILNVNGYAISRKNLLYSCIKFPIDLLRIIRKIQFDGSTIVYSNQYHDTPFSSVLSLLKGVPAMCHLRIPPPKKMDTQRAIALKGIRHFIAVSHQTKLEWVKSGISESAIKVVYNGTNTERFQPSDSPSKFRMEQAISPSVKVISYIGRLDRPKGVDILIKAFALLIADQPNLELLIAGKPLIQNQEYLQSLKQLAIELEIETHVHFLGHVNDTVSLYQASDVVVLPSIWSEPFGKVVIEAMACGTPVVASRVGGIPEILSEAFEGRLFEPRNVSDLAKTLTQVLDWKITNPQLGTACREHILKKFALHKKIDEIEKITLEVTGKRS